MASNSPWIWSEPHKDYYYVTYPDGNPTYTWAQAARQSTSRGAHSVPGHQPAESGSQPNVPADNPVQTPFSVPFDLRLHLPDLITGTPDRGPHELLDRSYRMRTGREAYEFFQKGRVFSMLWAEPASERVTRHAINEDGTMKSFRPGYTEGRFGEVVYSTIRRFVVVNVRPRDYFVYACPITTYSKRGVTKRGCNPKEHAIVYFQGTRPTYLPGEYGFTKNPIEVIPAVRGDTMDPASRVRFGKTFPVEWNVKVKDIGMVNSHHMPNLSSYWREERIRDTDEDDTDGDPSGSQAARQTQQQPLAYNYQPGSGYRN